LTSKTEQFYIRRIAKLEKQVAELVEINETFAKKNAELAKQDANTGKYLASGTLINKSFKETPDVISACSKKYLGKLPDSVKLIVMLGTSEAYIKNCFKVIKKLYPDTEMVNSVAYKSKSLCWVHLTRLRATVRSLRGWTARVRLVERWWMRGMLCRDKS
jgi:hypothetical protein